VYMAQEAMMTITLGVKNCPVYCWLDACVL
jgi:hypothetical protein